MSLSINLSILDFKDTFGDSNNYTKDTINLSILDFKASFLFASGRFIHCYKSIHIGF